MAPKRGTNVLQLYTITVGTRRYLRWCALGYELPQNIFLEAQGVLCKCVIPYLNRPRRVACSNVTLCYITGCRHVAWNHLLSVLLRYGTNEIPYIEPPPHRPIRTLTCRSQSSYLPFTEFPDFPSSSRVETNIWTMTAMLPFNNRILNGMQRCPQYILCRYSSRSILASLGGRDTGVLY